MPDSTPRYKTSPNITDTSGFFNSYVPYNPDKYQPANDSLKTLYTYPGYQYVPVKDTMAVHETVSVFKPHHMQVKNFRPLVKPDVSDDWIAGIFVFCLLIIALVQATVPRRLQQVFRSVALPYYVNQLEREGNLLSERLSIALGFVYLSSVSLLLYKLALYYSADLLGMKSGFFFYLYIFIICVILYFLKIGVVSFTGYVFNTAKITHEYLVNNLIFNIVTGLLLFPAVILSLYVDQPVYMWVALGIISILLIYRIIRSFMIGLSNTNYSVFYLFLYLCTLEILPLLLLYKTVQQF